MTGSTLTGRLRRVVVVEDNELLCRAVVRELTSWNAKVDSACSIGDALPLLRAPLDLIVSDVRLPDGNGISVFEQAALLDPQPLMLAMSGRASPSEAFQLAKMGVHAFLSKPFKVADLRRVVGGVFEQREAHAGTTTPEAVRRAIEVQLEDFRVKHGLSEQQSELLRLLLTGVSRKELPAALGVSENTCKTIIRRLLARGGAERLTDLVRELMVRSTGESVKQPTREQRRAR